MSRTIEVELFQFDELEETAKERARDWYRESNTDDSFWHESAIEQMVETLNACGFAIDTARGSKHTPAIYFSGFWSQGDGACFEGRWDTSLLWPVEKFQAEYPATYTDAEGKEQRSKHNTELHTINAESNRLAALDPQNGIGWACKHTGQYNHERSVKFDHYDESDADLDGAIQTDDIAQAHEENAREAMRWVYRTLEREWEWINSDEQVDESIRANEYEFTKEGKRA